MPPRKTKAKAAATSPKTRRSTRGAKANAPSEQPAEEQPQSQPQAEPSNDAIQADLPQTPAEVAVAVAILTSSPSDDTSGPIVEDVAEPQTHSTGVDVVMDVSDGVTVETDVLELEPVPTPGPSSVPATVMTREERQKKLEELRLKMRSTAQANRSDLMEEHHRQKTTARDIARLEKQRKLAAVLRERADAEETGIDSERKKNWEYSIEENDAWEKKQKRKAGRADFQFHDADDAVRKKYKKDLDLLKPDLEAYTRQKEKALGLIPGALSSPAVAKLSSTEIAVASSSQIAAAEDLYRDANTLTYGDNKPSEEAIDRMIGKLNNDIDKRGKFSRKRLNEEEGDITYINEHNKVFNKKISRFYDKYTKEIRDSFERGTAL